MDSFLELSSSVLTQIVPVFTGMRLYVTLKDSTELLSDVKLPVSSATIIIRETSSYFKFTAPMDSGKLDEVSAIITTAKLKYTLVMTTADGTEYGLVTEVIPFTSYRADRGAMSISLGITSDAYRTDTSGGSVSITSYSRKKKIVDGPNISYEYEVDPLLYRLVGLGHSLTEGDNNLTITSKSLDLSGGKIVFTVSGKV